MAPNRAGIFKGPAALPRWRRDNKHTWIDAWIRRSEVSFGKRSAPTRFRFLASSLAFSLNGLGDATLGAEWKSFAGY